MVSYSICWAKIRYLVILKFQERFSGIEEVSWEPAVKFVGTSHICLSTLFKY